VGWWGGVGDPPPPPTKKSVTYYLNDPFKGTDTYLSQFQKFTSPSLGERLKDFVTRERGSKNVHKCVTSFKDDPLSESSLSNFIFVICEAIFWNQLNAKKHVLTSHSVLQFIFCAQIFVFSFII
jgi:hypothetical protein